MREVHAPPRFAAACGPPITLEIGGERRIGRAAESACRLRAEQHPGDRLGLRDPVDGIGERAVAGIGESQARVAHGGALHLLRIERDRIEGGPAGSNQGSGIGVGAGTQRRHREPHRLAARVVREPGREDHVVLVRERKSPAGLRSGRRAPPRPLEVERGRRQRGIRAGRNSFGGKRYPIRTDRCVDDRHRPAHLGNRRRGRQVERASGTGRKRGTGNAAVVRNHEFATSHEFAGDCLHAVDRQCSGAVVVHADLARRARGSDGHGTEVDLAGQRAQEACLHPGGRTVQATATLDVIRRKIREVRVRRVRWSGHQGIPQWRVPQPDRVSPFVGDD